MKNYSHDDAFRITGITDFSDSGLSRSFSYDLLDRLNTVVGVGFSQNWTYDANGNRLAQGGNQSTTYTTAYASNQLDAVTGALTRDYTYDAAGNVTSDGTTTFTYNDSGRLVSAAKAGVTTTYRINALGQRTRKTTGATSRYFVYDEAGHLVGEYDGAGNLIQEIVWLGDTPVVALKPNGAGGTSPFYIHSDHLDTPHRISRPGDNVIVWRWDSPPFGSTPANGDPDGDGVPFEFNLRFPGQYFDPETGLHHNYFRDYDPRASSSPAGQMDPSGPTDHLPRGRVDTSSPIPSGCRAVSTHLPTAPARIASNANCEHVRCVCAVSMDPESEHEQLAWSRRGVPGSLRCG